MTREMSRCRNALFPFSWVCLMCKCPELMLSRWTVGSILFLASFAAVMGPLNYVYHLLSAPRLPFTAAYFGSITMTLVFAIKVGRFVHVYAGA
jgi:uncharacterized MnhB-related membrane protein